MQMSCFYYTNSHHIRLRHILFLISSGGHAESDSEYLIFKEAPHKYSDTIQYMICIMQHHILWYDISLCTTSNSIGLHYVRPQYLILIALLKNRIRLEAALLD